MLRHLIFGLQVGAVRITNRNVDPPFDPLKPGNCVTCTTTPTVVRVETYSKPPEPPVVKPPTKTVPSIVWISKVVSLPRPTYPVLAKQTRTQGRLTFRFWSMSRAT